MNACLKSAWPYYCLWMHKWNSWMKESRIAVSKDQESIILWGQAAMQRTPKQECCRHVPKSKAMDSRAGENTPNQYTAWEYRKETKRCLGKFSNTCIRVDSQRYSIHLRVHYISAYGNIRDTDSSALVHFEIVKYTNWLILKWRVIRNIYVARWQHLSRVPNLLKPVRILEF